MELKYVKSQPIEEVSVLERLVNNLERKVTGVHDLPNTVDRKDCWLETSDTYWKPTGDYMWTSHAYYSTSKTTGWDFPLEYERIAR